MLVKEKIRVQILNGSLQDYKNHLAGCYKGYYIMVDFQQPYYIVSISAKSENDENNAILKTFLARQKESIKYLTAADANDSRIILSIAGPNLVKNLPNHLNSVIDPIINYLISGRYISGCASCGSTMQVPNRYEVNGRHHYLCDSCANEVASALQENQQNVKAQKSNLAAGLVGAFLGALIGAVLWVLIYRLGYIAGLAGAITGICALKGYEMLGKHLDRKGVVFSIIIMFVVIYLANRIAWSWEVFDAFKDYYEVTFSDCYRSLNDVLAESDLTGSYYGDLFIGYLLTILCSARNIIGAFKSSGGSYSMKKMN